MPQIKTAKNFQTGQGQHNLSYSPFNGQVGGVTPGGTLRSSQPYEVKRNQFQQETGTPLAYNIEENKMPLVSLVTADGAEGKIGKTGAAYIHPFRSDVTYNGLFGEENMRAQFVKVDFMDSPTTFGHDRTI